LNECKAENGRCHAETDRLKKKLYAIETDNTELKRRLLASENFETCFMKKQIFYVFINFTRMLNVIKTS